MSWNDQIDSEKDPWLCNNQDVGVARTVAGDTVEVMAAGKSIRDGLRGRQRLGVLLYGI